MTPTFDLVHSPWIPCVTWDGSIEELGLHETLTRAHELRELHGESPLVEAALYRLLLAILHRVFGPAGYDAWGVLWRGGRWDGVALSGYLSRWRGRLDLFHAERPFLQASHPSPSVRSNPLTGVMHEFVSGIGVPLFNHQALAPTMRFHPAEAARHVLVAHAFGLAGTKGRYLQFTDSPWARGVIFLVQGQTLFQTLALNLMRYPDAERRGVPDTPEDRPYWEAEDPSQPERGVPLGLLDYLTWPNRHIRLEPEPTLEGDRVCTATMGPALPVEGDLLDPYKCYRAGGKSGWQPIRFSEERALWQDSAALFRMRRTEQGNGSRHQSPLAIHWVSSLMYNGTLPQSEPSPVLQLLAFGLATEPGRAKVYFSRSERLPLNPRYLRDEQVVESLHVALDLAESVGTVTNRAARTLATWLLFHEDEESLRRKRNFGREKRRERDELVSSHWAPMRYYWSDLEFPFLRTFDALADPLREMEAWTGWRYALHGAASRALDRVIGYLGNDPNALRASVHARDYLDSGLARALREHQEVGA